MYSCLVCPNCKNELQHIDNGMECTKCFIKYPIWNNIPFMLLEDAQMMDKASNTEEILQVKEKLHNGYSMVAELLESSRLASLVTFLNLGYAVNDNPQRARLEPKRKHLNKHSVKLLLEVLGDFDADDKAILEIGCGRGGNIATINDYFKPRVSWGLDLCAENIKFCSSRYKIDDMYFCVGDAEAIPFKDQFFDAVINIESADSYPDIRKFYRGVHSTLKPGGRFLYADVRPVELFEDCIGYLEEIGFKVARNDDVSSNVLLACDENAKKRSTIFGSAKSEEALEQMEIFLTAPGTKLYEEIKSGVQAYRIMELVKK